MAQKTQKYTVRSNFGLHSYCIICFMGRFLLSMTLFGGTLQSSEIQHGTLLCAVYSTRQEYWQWTLKTGEVICLHLYIYWHTHECTFNPNTTRWGQRWLCRFCCQIHNKIHMYQKKKYLFLQKHLAHLFEQHTGHKKMMFLYIFWWFT